MPDWKAKHLFRPIALASALVSFALPASSQVAEPTQLTGQSQPIIAVPPLPTPKNVSTEGGETGVIGIQIAQQIASDLRSSGMMWPMGPEKMRQYSPTEAGAPQYSAWASIGAVGLVTGYVQARDDGRITVACYLYDLRQQREMARKGFVVAAAEWKRAAHRCADAFYTSITGRTGYFDSRIAYVAESGTRTAPVKRLAIMNYDGSDHRYLTAGEVTVVTPEFSPDGTRLAYMSFRGNIPHVRLLEVASGADRPLLQQPVMSFAPAFSPDGNSIVFSMAVDGNTDLYQISVNGGVPQRLTIAQGTDTSPSFSPDGKQIVFESDRSGTQQLYVMNSDGTNQRRVSFGGTGYASPSWSPQGDLIAFTRLDGGGMRIGVMTPAGAGERMITYGWQDEAPSWAPSGQLLVFQRTQRGSGIANIYTVPLAGGDATRLTTPQPGSDPSWSGAS
jgi:TolB protein